MLREGLERAVSGGPQNLLLLAALVIERLQAWARASHCRHSFLRPLSG